MPLGRLTRFGVYPRDIFDVGYRVDDRYLIIGTVRAYFRRERGEGARLYLDYLVAAANVRNVAPNLYFVVLCVRFKKAFEYQVKRTLAECADAVTAVLADKRRLHTFVKACLLFKCYHSAPPFDLVRLLYIKTAEMSTRTKLCLICRRRCGIMFI